MAGHSSKQRVFLIISAIALTPIALSYGLLPERSLSWLFDIDATGTNTKHIFRAVMGLYFGMIVLWILGANRPELRRAALWSLVIFMFGLAAGRLLSLLVDGFAHPLLEFYMIVELVFGVIGWRLVTAEETADEMR